MDVRYVTVEGKWVTLEWRNRRLNAVEAFVRARTEWPRWDRRDHAAIVFERFGCVKARCGESASEHSGYS